MSLDASADGKQVAVLCGSAERFLDVNHLMLGDLDKGPILADFQKPGITREEEPLSATITFPPPFGNELALWSLPQQLSARPSD
ncbi:MAG: hypothetical protein DMG41_07755 [Acidobacteria bacterium]|nr:MAG: hypothetical protein DMG42_33845 [Acidobacteriota bacterium]PYT89751.1 MAG: hypothetical protein DMG41_07755 [Acidobacteriota bacterium]